MWSKDKIPDTDALFKHMSEDGMRCKIEIDFYNGIVEKAPVPYQNYDPNAKKVFCFNDLATIQSPLKRESDKYVHIFDLWSDETKILLRSKENSARVELRRRVDFVPGTIFSPLTCIPRSSVDSFRSHF